MPRYTWRSLGTPALALAIAGCRAEPSPSIRTESAGAQTPAPVVQAQDSINSSRKTALVAAADRVSPAVVSINVTSRQQTPRRTPWDFFFVPEGARVRSAAT